MSLQLKTNKSEIYFKVFQKNDSLVFFYFAKKYKSLYIKNIQTFPF